MTPDSSEREALLDALAQAEAARERLEIDLAQAVSTLFTTVDDASRVVSNRDEAYARVERARVRCRELRAALQRSGKSRAVTRTRDQFDQRTSQCETLIDRRQVAPASDFDEGSVATERVNPPSQSRPHDRMRRLNATPVPANLLRETVGLAALLLAYLQFYYWDVYLQIECLPSIWLISVLTVGN